MTVASRAEPTPVNYQNDTPCPVWVNSSGLGPWRTSTRASRWTEILSSRNSMAPGPRIRSGMGYWSIFASAQSTGWNLLTPVDLHGPEIEIGWRLVRAAWGRACATEAARPVLDHALHTLGLRRVVADIYRSGQHGIDQRCPQARPRSRRDFALWRTHRDPLRRGRAGDARMTYQLPAIIPPARSRHRSTLYSASRSSPTSASKRAGARRILHRQYQQRPHAPVYARACTRFFA